MFFSRLQEFCLLINSLLPRKTYAITFCLTQRRKERHEKQRPNLFPCVVAPLRETWFFSDFNNSVSLRRSAVA
jgi:hypothetical protein